MQRKMLEVVEKFGKLDEVHKKELYGWARKNAVLSVVIKDKYSNYR